MSTSQKKTKKIHRWVPLGLVKKVNFQPKMKRKLSGNHFNFHKKWKSMTFEEKMNFNPTFEASKFIRDLLNMENKEEQFEIATRLRERPKPLTKEEWKIICEIGDSPGFEKILFSKIIPNSKR